MFVLYLDNLIIVATVHTGMQTCAKVLQMHLPGGGATTWLQPKSNTTFELASQYLYQFVDICFVFR